MTFMMHFDACIDTARNLFGASRSHSSTSKRRDYTVTPTEFNLYTRCSAITVIIHNKYVLGTVVDGSSS